MQRGVRTVGQGDHLSIAARELSQYYVISAGVHGSGD
jgi:hypothetical protein